MRGSVARIEEATLDRDKGVIVLARSRSAPVEDIAGYTPLQEAIAMPVDDLDRIWICDRDVVGLDAYDFAQLLVNVVDRFKAFAAPALGHEPHIRERGWEWRRNFAETRIPDIGQDIVKDRQ